MAWISKLLILSLLTYVKETFEKIHSSENDEHIKLFLEYVIYRKSK